MKTLCIFEDEAYSQLLPMTYTRPVYDLVCGMTSLREKIKSVFAGYRIVLQCRAHLAPVLRREHPDIPVNRIPEGDCLFINGRILANADLVAQIPLDGKNESYFVDDTLAACQLNWERIRNLDLSVPLNREVFNVDKKNTIDAIFVQYPWDLVEKNEKQIEQDFHVLVSDGFIEGTVWEHVSFIERSKVYVGKSAIIRPGVVLDAERGPIYIGEGVTVFPNAVIEGPAYIGPKTQIKAGARITGGTTIGPVCKIGGEVDRSVILGFSNKQHDGYLGHSYIGNWVNFGAGTTNSDLKNNYHSVKVFVNGNEVDTGSLFVGLFIGDHSKSGVNMMFNAGTVIGICCNVFGAHFPPKFVPSFSWGGYGGFTEYDIEKVIGTARVVMARRDLELTAEEEELLRYVFHMTAEERRNIYQS